MLKFVYLNKDPWTNNTNDFVRILKIANGFGMPPQGNTAASPSIGILKDPSGNNVGYTLQGTYASGTFSQVIGSTTEYFPYSYSAIHETNEPMIIPPNWTFSDFGRAIGIQGSLEEVLSFRNVNEKGGA